MNTKRTFIAIFIVICFVVGVAAITLLSHKNSGVTDSSASNQVATEPANTDTNSSQGASTSTTPVADTSGDKYKNGTYTATGSYGTHAGTESINVSLTLVDDKVTDATVTPMPNDNISADFQQRFIGGFKTYVIGKDIDSIHLDVVSGASLTPEGFNSALATIKTEAQS